MDRPDRQPKEAIALRYIRGDGAPKVIAHAKGILGERIIATAQDAGVPVVADPDVLAQLAQTDIGREIPPEAYKAVACILAFIYALDTEKRPPGSSSTP